MVAFDCTWLSKCCPSPAMTVPGGIMLDLARPGKQILYWAGIGLDIGRYSLTKNDHSFTLLDCIGLDT